jgi:Protein of unknown function (DUF3052)
MSRQPDERDYSQRRLIDKLGVKPGALVSLLGLDDALRDELAERATVIEGEARPDSDLILLYAEGRSALADLASLQSALRRNGAIWVIWPKGRPAFKEDDVRAAALAVGLVDTKVIRFSDALSGLRLVIPVARR